LAILTLLGVAGNVLSLFLMFSLIGKTYTVGLKVTMIAGGVLAPLVGLIAAYFWIKWLMKGESKQRGQLKIA